jgi:N-acetylglutamate synthase-like GNAT family acetyltransferase
MTVRRAGSQDAAAIGAVLHASFAEFVPLYSEGGYRATVLTVPEVLERLREGPVWVALVDAAVVGTVAAIERESGLYVRGMAIVPAARGAEIGRALLDRVEAYARERALPRLFLSTTPFLHRAIALYAGLGFERTTGERDDLEGTPLITFEKVLR